MALEEILTRLEGKLDRVDGRLGGVDVILAKQTEQLGEHMRRTSLAESRLDHIQLEVDPLTRAHAMWSGVGKAVAVLGVIAGIVEGIIRIALRH